MLSLDEKKIVGSAEFLFGSKELSVSLVANGTYQIHASLEGFGSGYIGDMSYLDAEHARKAFKMAVYEIRMGNYTLGIGESGIDLKIQKS